MLTYLLSRLGESLVVLWVISIVAFGLMRLAPGDPAVALYGEQFLKMSLKDRQQIRQNLGLDRPLPVQYYKWAEGMLRGNLGRSYLSGQEVSELIGERLPATLLLSSAACVLIVFMTLVLGLYSGLKRYSLIDYGSTIGGFVLMSIPGFWLGLMSILLFSVWLRWLPSSGMCSIGHSPDLVDFIKHLVLPAAVLSLTHIGYYIRLLRGSVATVSELPFVAVLKSRGLHPWLITTKHILRNALIPFVTYLGVSVSMMLGGSVVTEAIFAWPGVGLLSVEAALRKDYPVLMGTILLSGLLVVLGSLTADLICAWLDPRIRLRDRPGEV